jgi:hypothetical protein
MGDLGFVFLAHGRHVLLFILQTSATGPVYRLASCLMALDRRFLALG